MADTKKHKAVKQHLTNARASLDKIEEIMAAEKGQEDQEPQAPPSGVSPLGGMARQ
jgi:hypothetical protein